MTNYAKVLYELIETAGKVREAKDKNDPKIEIYYQGKLDALKWIIYNNIIDTTK